MIGKRRISFFTTRRVLGRALLTWYTAGVLAVAGPLEALAQSGVDLAALDAYFEEARQAFEVPGFAVAIVKDGEVAFARGYGVRELGKQERVDRHTLFAIASNTKAFTVAALAILVDEGKIGWDDRVVEYLPYFQLYDPWVTQEMRVRDLLCHRSGLGTFSGDLLWYGTSYSAAQVVERARYLEPAGVFRSEYGYSNLMFIAAGEIIPAVAGRSWSDFVEAEIFEPLGMEHSVTSTLDLAGKANVATPHRHKDREVIPLYWYNWDAMAAAGGIISSVVDMARWMELQLDHGTWEGDTIFSERVQRTMWTPHISYVVSRRNEEMYPTTHFRGYGLGWGLMDYQGRKVMSHGGGYDGMFSRVALVPEERLGVVILTNGMTSLQTALTYKILDAYLGGEDRDWTAEFVERAEQSRREAAERRAKFESGRVDGTTPSLALEAYAGTYGGPMYGDANVTVEDGHLVVSFVPNPDLVGDLTHFHYDTFVIEWRRDFAWFDGGTVQFVMDPSGDVVEMRVDVPNEDLWFHELEFKKKD
ncbi:MAG: serine hydrolase [Gemmatimonadota bacterium]|nr:MAG: serine hydrolase [Gemmatimonadota bacterium]